jgi:hypothetical protein
MNAWAREDVALETVEAEQFQVFSPVVTPVGQIIDRGLRHQFHNGHRRPSSRRILE